MSFEAKQESKDGKVYFSFSGYIDEEAQFPDNSDISRTVVIDLENVKAINSVGIRSWLQWFQSFEGAEFTFLNCPKSVVMQMNMVEGFLPSNSFVHSFKVPYYCESCDEEVDALFHFGKEVRVDGGSIHIDFNSSSLCSDGGSAELDASESKYFRFLLKMDGKSAAA